ncbi:MAG: IS1380 family transposase [Burkholderiales bacterium]
MKPLRIVPLRSKLTARAGLVAVAKLLRHHAQLPQVLDPKFPVPGGFADSAVAMSYVALLCQGVTEFDAIENMRGDATFAQALGMSSLPSAPTVRQRIEQRGQDWLESLFDANSRLLRRAKVEPTPLWTGHVPLDLDVFVMDNSDSRKEGIGYTYAKVVGYAPVAAYLGREGFLLELSLREGTQHSAKETEYSLERVLPLSRTLTNRPLLVRLDSGFDSAKLYAELERQNAALGKVDWIVKWNPRGYNVQADYQQLLADPFREWTTLRAGKRVTLWRQVIGAQRRVYRLIEETIDRDGQVLLIPKLTVDGWNTSLTERSNAQIIALYADHGTHEQFHSELKSDMNLERLPSGKFNANDAVCSLAVLAYNALRIIGQNALIGADSPVRHKAERRRLKTVIREIICAPGQWIKHARQLCLGLPEGWAGFAAFTGLMRGPLFASD